MYVTLAGGSEGSQPERACRGARKTATSSRSGSAAFGRGGPASGGHTAARTGAGEAVVAGAATAGSAGAFDTVMLLSLVQSGRQGVVEREFLFFSFFFLLK